MTNDQRMPMHRPPNRQYTSLAALRLSQPRWFALRLMSRRRSLRWSSKRAGRWNGSKEIAPLLARSKPAGRPTRSARPGLPWSDCEVRISGEDARYCYDERKALEKAKRRLQLAEEKVQATRRWRAADRTKIARRISGPDRQDPAIPGERPPESGGGARPNDGGTR